MIVLFRCNNFNCKFRANICKEYISNLFAMVILSLILFSPSLNEPENVFFLLVLLRISFVFYVPLIS